MRKGAAENNFIALAIAAPGTATALPGALTASAATTALRLVTIASTALAFEVTGATSAD